MSRRPMSLTGRGKINRSSVVSLDLLTLQDEPKAVNSEEKGPSAFFFLTFRSQKLAEVVVTERPLPDGQKPRSRREIRCVLPQKATS
jgi:hypothetical protein